jgi:putative two-component system response regulator
MRELLAAGLCGARIACDRAANGAEAIDLCKRRLYNVAVVDLQMPGMAGLEVVEALREFSRGTRIIIATAHGDMHSLRKALRARVDDYLMKPFELEEFLASVERSLERQTAMRDILMSCQQMTRRLSTMHRQLQRRFVGGIVSLAAALEARDPYTRGHAARVANMAVKLGRAAGFHGEQLDELIVGALLHDMGKIAVPDAVLLKKGKLTDEEYETIRLHPRAGLDILTPFFGTGTITDCALSHHERWDGRGYPGKLAKDSAPIAGRLISVCDVYDAMTSARPYRGALPQSEALSEVQRGRETQFDPEVADMFLSLRPYEAAGA